MKNDLTTEEWKVLANYLSLGPIVFEIWKTIGMFEYNSELFKSAKEKVINTASKLR